MNQKVTVKKIFKYLTEKTKISFQGDNEKEIRA